VKFFYFSFLLQNALSVKITDQTFLAQKTGAVTTPLQILIHSSLFTITSKSPLGQNYKSNFSCTKNGRGNHAPTDTSSLFWLLLQTIPPFFSTKKQLRRVFPKEILAYTRECKYSLRENLTYSLREYEQISRTKKPQLRRTAVSFICFRRINL